MAAFLPSKVAAEIVQRRYAVPVDKDDNPASVSFSATGVTVVSTEIENAEVLINISGGTAGETASIVLTVTTDEGRTLVQTLYLPIIASAAQIAHTAREYVTFALRRVIGNGETPSADEMTDALERLNAMVAEWRAQGADIGAAFPIVAETVIYCPDYAVPALRYNLLLDVASLYGEPVTQMEAMKARQGLSLVKNMNVPDVREATYF
jgi:hypothetical protein